MRIAKLRHKAYRTKQESESLLLDNHPALLAFWLKKIKSDYSSNAILVRESDLDAELGIGFVDRDLDTSTLLTHTGANNGLLPVWYNQSTAVNLVQSTDSIQPQIVSSGSLETEGRLAAVNFSGNKSFGTSSAVSLASANEMWLFLVLNITNSSASQMIYETSATNVSNSGSIGVVIFSNTLIIQQNNAGGRVQVSVPISTGYQLISIKFKGGESDINSCDVWVNGSIQTKTLTSSGTSPSTYTDYEHYVGARNNSSLKFSGTIQGVILMTGDKSSARTEIETSIKNDYPSLP